MKHAIVVAFLLFSSASAKAGIDGTVMLFPIETSFRSVGEAGWYGALGELDTAATLTGTHGVYGPMVFTTPITVTGRYYGELEGPTQPGACYGTRLEVTANRGFWGSTTRTIPGNSRCAPSSVPKDDPEPIDCETNTCPPHSPIVISFDGRFDFTDVQDGVRFDINADGRTDHVAWPRDGTIAFLFYDRNGNGRPDNGSELFGEHTPRPNGSNAAHGFEALADFDTNLDGFVAPEDAQWTSLGLWRDTDHNGIATNDEISTLTSSGISSLGLRYHWSGRRDAHGNMLRWRAELSWSEPRRGRAYYDVYLLTLLG